MNWLKKYAGFDIRSLALFRVALGMFLLFNLFVRAADLSAFYSDDGILPRSLLLKSLNPWMFSLYMAGGKSFFLALLFVISAFFAFLFMIGYRTRLCTFITWFLFASLEVRNPDVLSSGDREIRLLLFWSLFLPIQARFSVDSALDSSAENETKLPPAPTHIFSGGTVGFMLQIALIYWSTALLKSGPDWHAESSAVYFALNLEMFANPLSKLILHFPALVKILTPAVLYFEYLGPFFLLVPTYGRILSFVRLTGVMGFWLMHLGLGMCLALGTFSYIASIAFIAFLPGLVWEWLGRLREKGNGKGITLCYDQDCGFCKKMAHLTRTFLLLPQAEIKAAQSDAGTAALMQRDRSWVAIDATGNRHTQFAAFRVLMRASPLFFGSGFIFDSKFCGAIGDHLYRLIADHRGFFGMLTTPLKFRPLTIQQPRWTDLLALFFALYIFIWNMQHVCKGFYLPATIRTAGYIMRLEQYWSMFAPSVPKDDGWFVIPGTLANGSQVDLLQNGKALDWEKPRLLSKIYKNARWRAFHRPLFYAKYKDYRSTYAGYLCNVWNRRHRKGPQELVQLDLYLMREITLPDYQPAKIEKILLLHHVCSAVP